MTFGNPRLKTKEISLTPRALSAESAVGDDVNHPVGDDVNHLVGDDVNHLVGDDVNHPPTDDGRPPASPPRSPPILVSSDHDSDGVGDEMGDGDDHDSVADGRWIRNGGAKRSTMTAILLKISTFLKISKP
jgi:hypothetical protein